MRLHLREGWQLLKKTYTTWSAKDPFRESAVIAYYALFSIPALIVIVVSIAGLFFEKELISGYLYSQIGATMGISTAEAVRLMVLKAADTGKSLVATIIGVVVLLLGATGVFAQLQKSLNIIWDVKVDPKKETFLRTLRIRLFSFGLIVSIGFLLLISLIATSIMTAIGEHLRAAIPQVMIIVFYAFNFILSFTVIAILFALMFKVLPDVTIEWRSVRVGAILTALLFVIGKFALAIYFGTTDQVSVYGPAGSVVLLLLWVSYSSMIVFFGAEFTKIYTDRFFGPAAPNEIARRKPGRKQ